MGAFELPPVALVCTWTRRSPRGENDRNLLARDRITIGQKTDGQIGAIAIAGTGQPRNGPALIVDAERGRHVQAGHDEADGGVVVDAGERGVQRAKPERAIEVQQPGVR